MVHALRLIIHCLALNLFVKHIPKIRALGRLIQPGQNPIPHVFEHWVNILLVVFLKPDLGNRRPMMYARLHGSLSLCIYPGQYSLNFFWGLLWGFPEWHHIKRSHENIRAIVPWRQSQHPPGLCRSNNRVLYSNRGDSHKGCTVHGFFPHYFKTVFITIYFFYYLGKCILNHFDIYGQRLFPYLFLLIPSCKAGFKSSIRPGDSKHHQDIVTAFQLPGHHFKFRVRNIWELGLHARRNQKYTFLAFPIFSPQLRLHHLPVFFHQSTIWISQHHFNHGVFCKKHSVE